MVKILGQIAPNLLQKEVHNYLTFTWKYMFMIFNVKVNLCGGCRNNKTYQISNFIVIQWELTWAAL